MKFSRMMRRGMTLTELLVGLILVSVVAMAVMALFRTSWLSYQNLVWQSKVNMEARRTLDDICDTLRMGGANIDLTSPARAPKPQVHPSVSGANIVQMYPIGQAAEVTYQVLQRHGGQNYLTRQVGQATANIRLVGQHIKQVDFEYEYRLPAGSENDTAWQSIRVSRPGNVGGNLAHTIYVTVTAEVSPFGSDGTTYTRRLTSAVHLRGPYNTRIPRAKYIP